ncbi:MAG: hypothetical protein U0987_17920 [Afipia sp.]|nr:hypothetical protein [Afipia sp.]
MIGRIFLIVCVCVVSLVTASAAIGVMLADVAGEHVQKIWAIATKPRERSPIEDRLAGTKDLTFFKTAKVDNRPYLITMGVSFATPEDLASGKQKLRWCYATVMPKDGGVPRQIELAMQEGSKAPRYADLTGFAAAELAALGETAESLATIARKHCVFGKEPARSGTVARRFTTIVLKAASEGGTT